MKVNSILVSQPAPTVAEKSPYYEIHTKFKTKVDYRPFIKVEGVSLKEYRSQRTDILEHTAVIFTSRTTIDHFFRICDEARITVPESMKYICNTEATALYLQKYIVYRKRKIFFADGSFSNFMELIMKHKEEKYLLVLSEPHKPEIPETLHKLKLKYDKVILSRTVSTDLSGMDISKYDMLAFFSPSEIASLISNFGTENLPRIATFGNGTTRAAIEAGITVSIMAPTPEAPSMAKAIELYIKKINSGEEVSPVVIAEKNKQAEEFIKNHESKPVKKRSAAKKTMTKKSTAKPNGTKSTVKAKAAATAAKNSTVTTPTKVSPAGKATQAKASEAKTNAGNAIEGMDSGMRASAVKATEGKAPEGKAAEAKKDVPEPTPVVK